MKNSEIKELRKYKRLFGEAHAELANIPFANMLRRRFGFPGIDDQHLEEGGWSTNGELPGIASKCLMKLMYSARTMRWDFLQPLTTLAHDSAKWNRNCDVRMHKLFCYAAQTIDHSMGYFCAGINAVI